ncbi:zeatin O-xylosyltransferase-like [Lycium barbarum]|uniref:zeatin O-xylosyltransferase-like n=1 Tax=Lycium barbarum TaxID=112863 RepID=UPI00293E0C4B|nr:zeatin O-xylosyltransferase-like [Lycium barbarum]
MKTWVVQDVPDILNAECYFFNSISAFHMYSSFWEIKGKPFQAGTELYEDIPSLEGCSTPEIWELWTKQESLMGKFRSGELHNSSRVIESLYLDLVAKENDGRNLWALGQFSPLLPEQNKDSNKTIKPCIGLTNKKQTRDADKGNVFAGEERRAQLPEGSEERKKEEELLWFYESLWMEFVHGKHFHGSSYSSLANSFRSAKEFSASNKVSEN